ncbi:MAG: hypothetical protein WCR99_10315 [Sphaerochaeta sp.]
MPHRHNAVFLLLLLLLLASCSREELALVDLQTNVAIHVHPAEGRKEQLLTLVFTLTGQPAEKQVHVVAGNQKSSWVVKAQGDEKGRYTIGPLSMGRDVLLPQGRWDLSILSEDGQTVKESFVVSYQTPRDLVAYDKATKTIALGDVSAMLTLYGDTDTPLSVQQLEPEATYVLDETVKKAVVYLEQQETTYIISN